MKRLQDVYFRKTNLTPNGDMVFDQKMLTLLLAIDENKSILDVAREVKLEAAVFKDCLVKLYKLKLIEKVDKHVEYVNGQFLSSVRQNLVQLLGPLGEVLMDDAAEQMNVTEDKIPKDLVADYLMAIANEIPSEKQRREFQKNMLDKIKAMEEE